MLSVGDVQNGLHCLKIDDRYVKILYQPHLVRASEVSLGGAVVIGVTLAGDDVVLLCAATLPKDLCTSLSANTPCSVALLEQSIFADTKS